MGTNPLAGVGRGGQLSQRWEGLTRKPRAAARAGDRAMNGLEVAILIPSLILGCAAILYFGLIHVRDRRAERSGESTGE